MEWPLESCSVRTNIVYRCSWKKLALLLILLFVPLLTQFNCGLDVFLDPVITFWGVTHHLSHLCGGYDKPLFSLFQPLYLYFLSFLFVQRPQRERSPVEHRGNLSICPSVHPSVHPSFCLPSVQYAQLFKFSLNTMEKWQKAVQPCPLITAPWGPFKFGLYHGAPLS